MLFLDMVKTRFQLNSGQNPSVFSYMATVFKTEGIMRFYRGMGAEMVGMVPKSSAMYASYELFRRIIDDALLETMTDNPFKKSAIVCSLAGGFSGIPEAVIITPTQVVKVRLQSKDYIGKYTNSLNCAVKIVKEEGLAMLMTGLGPTLLRNSVWNSVYFGSMQYLKVLSNSIFPAKRSFWIDRTETLFTGFTGAVFATCFNAPFDVVKSRFQSQLPSSTPKYRSTFQSLGLILKEEGLAACYKGFQPKAIRMGLGGGVAMLTFEMVCHVLH